MATRTRIEAEMVGCGYFDLPPGSCTRVIEIRDAASLFTLADAILQAFGFQMDHAFGYYDNLSDQYASTEVHTSFADFIDGDPDHGKSVKKTKVSAVFSKGTERLFMFDYGDDWQFRLRCLETGIAGGAGGARVIGSRGDAPPQYPDEEDDEEEEARE